MLLETAVQPALINLDFKYARRIELNTEFIHVLPTLTHLSFTSCDNVNNVLEVAMRVDHLWPHLHTLMISQFLLNWIKPLCDFVAKRISIGLPLKCVKLGGRVGKEHVSEGQCAIGNRLMDPLLEASSQNRIISSYIEV